MKRMMVIFQLMLVVGCSLVLCSCTPDTISELRGTAKADIARPDLAQQQVPESKVYKASQEQIVDAVKRCLKDDGIMYQSSQEGKTVSIVSEEVSIQQVSTMRMMFGGSNYTARYMIDVEPDGLVTFRSRIDKSLSGLINTKGVKDPEKEKELRADFFQKLDRKLGSTAVQ